MTPTSAGGATSRSATAKSASCWRSRERRRRRSKSSSRVARSSLASRSSPRKAPRSLAISPGSMPRSPSSSRKRSPSRLPSRHAPCHARASGHARRQGLLDRPVKPGDDRSEKELDPLAHLVGSGLVALLRLRLIGSIGIALAHVLAAVPTLAPVVAASAAVMLAIALVALAVLPATAAAAEISAAGPDISAAASADIAALGLKLAALVVGAFRIPARVTVAAIRAFALLATMLRPKLRLRRHDDAIVMLGMLKVALGRHQVARGESVARERHVFLGDMRRRAPDLHVGAVRFVVPR